MGGNLLKGVEFLAETAPADSTSTININNKADMTGNNDTLARSPSLGGLLSGALTKISPPAAITDATHPPLTVYFDKNSMKDLWLLIRWGK